MKQSRGIEVNWPFIKDMIALIFLLAGLLMLGLSVYGFLRIGEWGAPSLMDTAIAFEVAPAFFREWVGLTKILDYIPLWVALMVIGYFVMIAE